MEYVNFTDADKIKIFDVIAGHFYNRNFGQTSKADIELMMFDFYIQQMIKENQNDDGTIDYDKCSDYKISKDLGITQQRVRNLKVKNQLVHPIEYDWTKAFAKLIEKAWYDTNTNKVIINIPDPNLYYEIENFLDEQGAYIEKQMNSKILQVRVEYFIDLIIATEPPENQKEIIKQLKKAFKAQDKIENKFNGVDIGKFLIENGANIIEIIAYIAQIVSDGNPLIVPLTHLLKKR